jgi:hypothetical protein
LISVKLFILLQNSIIHFTFIFMDQVLWHTFWKHGNRQVRPTFYLLTSSPMVQSVSYISSALFSVGLLKKTLPWEKLHWKTNKSHQEMLTTKLFFINTIHFIFFNNLIHFS